MPKVAIIGGGIGGLTMAVTLKKLNLDFVLYEKASAFREVGAGVGIGSNALSVFDRLGLGQSLRSHGHLLTKTIFTDKKLNVLKTIHFPDEVYCVHRATVIDLLANELESNYFELGKEVEHIENGKTIKISFTDKTSINTDSLIGGSLRFLFLPLNDTQMMWLAVQSKKNFIKDASISLKDYLIECCKDFAPIV